MKKLYVKGVTSMSLFFTSCPCGATTVHGFWHQLDSHIDRERRLAWASLRCDSCGVTVTRHYRLTSGRRRRWDDGLLDACVWLWRAPMHYLGVPVPLWFLHAVVSVYVAARRAHGLITGKPNRRTDSDSLTDLSGKYASCSAAPD